MDLACSDDLVKHSTDDPMECLEWLENSRELTVHMKDQIKTLRLNLRFLRTFLKGMEDKEKGDLRFRIFFTKNVRSILQDAALKLHSLCPRATTDRSLNRDLELSVSSVIEVVNDYKQETRERYVEDYLYPRSSAYKRNEILKELVDSLLENLKDLQGCESDLLTLLKKHIEALEERVLWVRDFLGWLVDRKDSKDDVQNNNFHGLLNGIEYAIDSAAYLSYFCLVDEVDENARLKCNISFMIWMIKHIESEVKEILVGFIKDSTLLQPDSFALNLLAVATIDSLLNILMQLQKSESTFMVPFEKKVATLILDLRFLRALLMDPPARNNDKREKVDSLLLDIEALIKDTESSIHSLKVCEMKEATANEMDLFLSSFLDKMELIKSNVRDNYVEVPRKSQFKFLGIDKLGSIDRILKNLDEILKVREDSTVSIKHEVETIHGELVCLSVLLNNILQNCDNHDVDLLDRVIDVAYKAEYAINSHVIRYGPSWDHMLQLFDSIEELMLIKTELTDIFNKKTQNKLHNIQMASPLISSSKAHTIRVEESVVGFEEEAAKITERLTGGSKQLDLVSIVGMPGLGKTTLSRKVYDDLLLSNHFYIYAWCCVSQEYQKRELLLDILSQVVEVTDQMRNVSEQDLAEKLYKRLKGMKYLIVLDDIWNINAWNDISRFLPDDHNRSRIMITTRIYDVALQAKPNSPPIPLRLFSEEESWKLLQERIFRNTSCPMELVEVGKEIARNCKGLPLAVVLVAGILTQTDLNIDRWKQVVASLSTFIASDSRQWMEIMELSYKHLPNHLKPCFLYFGAFAEDAQVPVQKMLKLWIAEGFVWKIEEKDLEDVAEDYLRDLVGRSLVMVGKSASKGGLKTCHVHDLLHNLCMEKAKEERFFRVVHGTDELYASSFHGLDDGVSSDSHYSSAPQQSRLCIHSKRRDFVTWKPSNRHLRSLLFFATEETKCYSTLYSWDLLFIFFSLKLLKVLDVSSISLGDTFPDEIELLKYLRYLAVRGGMDSVPDSIVNLSYLETLFVRGVRGEISLPDTIWDMVNLRHILIKDSASIKLLSRRNSNKLHNLKTLGVASVSIYEEKLIKGFPNLQKFKCIFRESWNAVTKCNQFLALDTLEQLESLKIFYHGHGMAHPCKFIFPSNLKKLALTKFRLPWNQISQIGRLPNLEVLKLLFKSFEDQTCDMNDGEFPSLKYLKLEGLDIAQWHASSDHFPCLERLVVLWCKKLAELPLCLGEVLTLQEIEMQWCSPSAAKSARQIKEDQKDIGNEELKLLVKNC